MFFILPYPVPGKKNIFGHVVRLFACQVGERCDLLVIYLLKLFTVACIHIHIFIVLTGGGGGGFLNFGKLGFPESGRTLGVSSAGFLFGKYSQIIRTAIMKSDIIMPIFITIQKKIS